VTLVALEGIPSFEYILVAVAVLLGIIGKIVEFSKSMRQKSIEAERKGEEQFGADLGEAAEPSPEPPPRLELFRRPPRPRLEEVLAPPAPPPRPPPARPPVAPRPRREHEVVRMLRTPHGAKNAVILAEVFGPPKGLRRGR
jgi:hypothetical protein